MAAVASVGQSVFYKIAGVSGFFAVIAGAYGSHAPSLNKPEAVKYKEVMQTGNLYHLVHTIVLLAVPFANKPKLVGGIFVTGMTLFSGSCYVVALAQNRKLGRLAPVGGTLLMAGWLAFLL
ncbi:transmembrane protein 256 homolog [Exaiptasia diaphana]|uniref:Transmembrane protein 256 homolog n=1 Tax=Exaiptasia diaphana TaxID=2652724 RepID=A0A913XCN8_EXADI|nr:transmembrane protein 256 homolog [Exaiptasia diaphana]KXJ29700.1 Transmembrane protein 256-like [Exaiptasia diaphana]